MIGKAKIPEFPDIQIDTAATAINMTLAKKLFFHYCEAILSLPRKLRSKS